MAQIVKRFCDWFVKSLNELNREFWLFIEEEYNNEQILYKELDGDDFMPESTNLKIVISVISYGLPSILVLAGVLFLGLCKFGQVEFCSNNDGWILLGLGLVFQALWLLLRFGIISRKHKK